MKKQVKTIPACESCVDPCLVRNEKIQHCDCYNGSLKNVKYNGNRDLYESEVGKE